MSDILVGVGFSLLLFLVGLWGRRNVSALVPRSMSSRGQQRRETELRRGSTALIGLAVLVLIGCIARVVSIVMA